MIIEKHPFLKVFRHGVLLLGVIIMCLPMYVAFIASTHTSQDLMQAPFPWWPGEKMLENYMTVLGHGLAATGGKPVAPMLWRSFVMAFTMACGKIIFALLSAFALMYFHFPLRKVFFLLVFITLMLPVEVRILPTFAVVAQLHMLNSYYGLTIPLLASATATFLFRQFFMTIPPELVEAARLDGAGPLRFLFDILIPLSRTNIAALFVIMFIYGWNQYLWPLVITTKQSMTTIVMGMQQLANVADQVPQWNYVMVMAILAMLPPVIVVILMQRLVVKGLIEIEK